MNRLIKIFTLVACLAALTTKANAAGEAMFSKGHSTWTVEGVYCTSGTAVEITKSLTGFNISAYRLTNQETTVAVYIGPDSSVSTHTASSSIGEKLIGGANGVWEIGVNPDQAIARVKIFCKAADAAGQQMVRLTRAVFGYK